jgi:hypothetical protein
MRTLADQRVTQLKEHTAHRNAGLYDPASVGGTHVMYVLHDIEHPERYRGLPKLFWIAIALGGRPTSRFWHPFAGLLFFVAAMWIHEIWRNDVHMTDAVRAWLDKTKEYAANRDDLVPPQGRFNAGQKLYYRAMFDRAFLPILSGVGFVMVPGR